MLSTFVLPWQAEVHYDKDGWWPITKLNESMRQLCEQIESGSKEQLDLSVLHRYCDCLKKDFKTTVDENIEQIQCIIAYAKKYVSAKALADILCK